MKYGEFYYLGNSLPRILKHTNSHCTNSRDGNYSTEFIGILKRLIKTACFLAGKKYCYKCPTM
jgi:hypothetical protein